jgi:hypothetical protein
MYRDASIKHSIVHGNAVAGARNAAAIAQCSAARAQSSAVRAQSSAVRAQNSAVRAQSSVVRAYMRKHLHLLLLRSVGGRIRGLLGT